MSMCVCVCVYSTHRQDTVFSGQSRVCVRCLSWPPQAADWPTRHRNYDWPDSATVDLVLSNGCDVVPVAHRRCRQDEWMNTHQCRLSFARAEIVLLNSWIPVQQIVYHMLRVFVKTERLTDSANNSDVATLTFSKRVWGATYIKLGGDVGQSVALPIWVSEFRCVASFRNYSALKAKFRPNFALFDSM